MLLSLFARWLRNESAGVSMMFGFAAPLLLLGAGITVDYGLYSRDKVRLAMIADEATLSIVSSSGMNQSISTTSPVAQCIAQNLFNAQASQISPSSGIAKLTIPPYTICNPANPTLSPSPTITVTTNGNVRVATLSVTATYTPIFASVLNFFMAGNGNALPLSAGSTAQSASTGAANTNYYVLLDNQGSMALPDSSAGISQMESLTPQQLSGGCAFACHEAAPNNPAPGWSEDTQGNPCVSGSGSSGGSSGGGHQGYGGGGGSSCQQIDNYQLAKNNGITLRFDDVVSAMSGVITDAQNTQSSATNPPTYQFAVYSVDAPYSQGLYQVMALTPNYATQWSTSSANLQLYTVYSDGGGCASSGGNPCGTYSNIGSWNGSTVYPANYNAGFFSSPMGTEMSSLASTIPAAGPGTPGNAPKEVLMIVTDGVEDTVVNSDLTISAWDSTALNACKQLKGNGVQIAILYTTYYPQHAGFWLYDDFIAPLNPGTSSDQIASTLSSCASPGLFMTAGLDDNIPKQLDILFQLTQQTSKLTQ